MKRSATLWGRLTSCVPVGKPDRPTDNRPQPGKLPNKSANAAGAGNPPRMPTRYSQAALFLLFSAVSAAQVSMPLIGYYRDRAGALRQVHGVAGAFVPGEVIQRDVISVAWSGTAGFAKTETELLVLDANGISKRAEAPAGPATFGFLPDGQPAWVRFADDSCRRFATDCPSEPRLGRVFRVRLPEDVESYEQLGDGWTIARGKDTLYAVRNRDGSDQAYELPEAEP